MKLLIPILLIAAILRIWALDRVPIELFGDELDVGYHAYSILKTGRDYSGQFLPTYIHSFAEWRAPLQMYVTVPFVWVFGLNEWGVRLPSSIFGIISVFLLYFVVHKTLGNKSIALLASFFLATSPWHLQYSRAAFEVSLLLALILGGVLCFLLGLKNRKWFLGTAVLFALTFYTYSTASLFTPLLIILLILINRKALKTIPIKSIVLPAFIFVIVSLPILYHIFFGFAAERFSTYSVFSQKEVSEYVNQERTYAQGSFISHIFYNKPLVWVRRILANYATAFSPQFLFIDGDDTFRHSIHRIGQLYWVQLPFLIFGLFWFSKKKLLGPEKFWVPLLILAPVPASLTWDGAHHATRLILMLPSLMVVAASGTVYLLELTKRIAVRNLIVTLLFLIFVAEFALYLRRYWVEYPRESWRWWHYGYKEAILYMKASEDDYKVIGFNSTYEPALIRFLFWWQYPPERFQKVYEGMGKQVQLSADFAGFELDSKYRFRSSVPKRPDRFLDSLNSDTIYLVSQRDEVPGDWDWSKDQPSQIKVLKVIRNLYGEPIFYVVTGKL